MSLTYSYDPIRITDNGLNQMRFELGDTATEGGKETCVLCDEEYVSILLKAEKEKKSFKYAKIQCLKAIVMKLSYEVDYKVSDMSISLSARCKRFKIMLDKLESSTQIPIFTAKIGDSAADGGHYFHLGMQENNNAK